MDKIGLDILGVAETLWTESGEFKSTIPTNEEVYTVIYSGGKKHRKGVGFILNKKAANTIMYYELISERIICLKLQAKHNNILIIQIYAPNEDSEEVKRRSSTKNCNQ